MKFCSSTSSLCRRVRSNVFWLAFCLFVTSPGGFPLAGAHTEPISEFTCQAAQPEPEITKTQESAPSNPAQNEEAQGLRQDEPVTEDTEKWLVIKPAEARAEFKVPRKPQLTERMFTPIDNQPPIKVRNHLLTFNNEKGLFLFSYHDLHQVPAEGAIEETLRGAMHGSILSVNGRLLKPESRIRYHNHPGFSFEFRFANKEVYFKGFSRVFLVGQRQYQITAILEETSFDEKIANAFLNSLRLIEAETETENSTDAGQKDIPPSERVAPEKKGSQNRER
jgi:hypothetical protein